MAIPFNEPLVAANALPSVTAEGNPPGSHWAMLVIRPLDKSVTYKSSKMDGNSGMEALEVCHFL